MSDLFSLPTHSRTVRETSIEAMRSAGSRAPNLRTRCYNVLASHGPQTADEVAERLEETVLSVRPQFTLLTKENKIADTGERRKNESGRMAIVWRATDPWVWKEATTEDKWTAEQERGAVLDYLRASVKQQFDQGLRSNLINIGRAIAAGQHVEAAR